MSQPPMEPTPSADAEGSAGEEQRSRVERAQLAAERAKATAGELLERAEASRARFRTLDAAFVARDTDRRVAGSLLAGALAFRLFLAILPTILVVVGVTGLFGLGEPAPDVTSKAHEVGMTAFIVDLIRGAAESSAVRNIVILAVGLVGMWFGSRALLKGLRIIFALAWRLQPPRTFVSWQTSLIAMGVVAAAWFVSLVMGILRAEALGIIGGALVTLASGFGLILVLQRFLPHAEGAGWRDFVPGAIGQAVGMLALQVATEFYFIDKAASYSSYYGGLGVAAVLLLWFYVYARLTVAAVVYNAALWYKNQPGEAPASRI